MDNKTIKFLRSEIQRLTEAVWDKDLRPDQGSTRYNSPAVDAGYAHLRPGAKGPEPSIKSHGPASISPKDMDRTDVENLGSLPKKQFRNGKQLINVFFAKGSKGDRYRLIAADQLSVRESVGEAFAKGRLNVARELIYDKHGKAKVNTTPQEIYLYKTARWENAERAYASMSGDESSFDTIKSELVADEEEISKLGDHLQLQHNIVDVYNQFARGGSDFINLANHIINDPDAYRQLQARAGIDEAEGERWPVQSFVTNPDLLDAFIETFERSKVDPVKKRFAAGEFDIDEGFDAGRHIDDTKRAFAASEHGGRNEHEADDAVRQTYNLPNGWQEDPTIDPEKLAFYKKQYEMLLNKLNTGIFDIDESLDDVIDEVINELL